MWYLIVSIPDLCNLTYLDDYDKKVGLVQTLLRSSQQCGSVEALLHMGMMGLALLEPDDSDDTE